MKPRITEIKFFRPDEGVFNQTLLAYASCVINKQIYFGGIEIHYDGCGELMIKFPEIDYPNSGTMPLYHPLDPDIYFGIQDAILSEWEHIAY